MKYEEHLKKTEEKSVRISDQVGSVDNWNTLNDLQQFPMSNTFKDIHGGHREVGRVSKHLEIKGLPEETHFKTLGRFAATNPTTRNTTSEGIFFKN